MNKLVARLIYDSDSAQSVTSGDAITFASTTLASDVSYSLDGQIQLKKPGTYLIYSNFTALATEEGNVGVEMVEGLTSVAGANAAASATSEGDYIALSFTAASTVHPTSAQGYASLYFTPTTNTDIVVANVIIERVN